MADRNRYEDQGNSWQDPYDEESSEANRDQGYGAQSDRVSDRDRGGDRTRQWRATHDYDYNTDEERNYGTERDFGAERNVFGNRYGQNYQSIDMERDQEMGQQNMGRSSRRNYRTGQGYRSGGARQYRQNPDRERSQRYYQDYQGSRDRRLNRGQDWDYGPNRQYNRDPYRNWDYQQGRSNRDFERARDYDRDYYRPGDYTRDRDYDWYRDYDRDPRYDQSWNRETGFDRYTDRGQGRQFGQRGFGGQYRTAGMGSDYGTGFDYEERYDQDEDLDYFAGDIGYESEGAFYQDLDEPVNYEYWEIWMVPGPFIGMGPSNYQRSDDRILEQISDRMTQHGRLDPSDIEIQVKEGEVTLTGSVPSREMKHMAEETAESVAGVIDVHNQLRIQRQDLGSEQSQRQGQESMQGQRQVREKSQPQAQSPMQGQEQIRAQSQPQGQASQSRSGQAATSQANKDVAEEKRSQIHEGMEVLGKNGKVIGRVKEVRNSDFLVNRDMAHDVYVPFDAVKSVGQQALLDIPSEEVDNQDWPKPA